MTDATKASEVAERLVSWVHMLGPIQEAKGLTLNAASGLSATVHIDGDRNAVVPRLLNDIREAEALIRAQSERERVLVEALRSVNTELWWCATQLGCNWKDAKWRADSSVGRAYDNAQALTKAQP